MVFSPACSTPDGDGDADADVSPDSDADGDLDTGPHDSGTDSDDVSEDADRDDEGDGDGDTEIDENALTMWAPFREWSLENATWDGNPYDVIARVTFTHTTSGTTHRTLMFYDDDTTWKFRFTGSLAGRWTVASESDDPELDGYADEVIVIPNPTPEVRGFLTHQGNRYAIQTSDENDLEGYLYTVFMDGHLFDSHIPEIGMTPDEAAARAADYLELARSNGFETIFVSVYNSWFELGAKGHDEHDSEEPDPATFRALEAVISTVHAAGGRVHLWAWGDESRRWTPIGVGGINGTPDQRVQRYIAARLGPLPGWSMGYGFDLHEWVSGDDLREWSDRIHAEAGWPHLLAARGEPLEGADSLYSYDGFGRSVPLTTTDGGPRNYDEIVDDLEGNHDHPHLYEERHSYLRDGFDLSMEGTRRLLWWEAMAGGMGGFFGFYDSSPHPYPNPEQLRTHHRFWHGGSRFQLGMSRDNQSTSGVALRGDDCAIFYEENTDSVQVDLSWSESALSAIAVDTALEYEEVSLGDLTPSSQTLDLPRRSDWAVAVGDF